MTRRTTTLALAVVLMAVGCSSSTATSSGSAGSGPSGTGSVPPGSTVAVSNAKHGIGHLFIINLENESYEQTYGPGSPATYLNSTLIPQGKLLDQYHAIGHASLDNYLAQISGQAPNKQTQADCFTFSDFQMTGTAALGQAIGTGCVFPKEVQTVADQLLAKGLTWKGYMEDMGNDPAASPTCRHPEIGAKDPTIIARKTDQYATRHNPFVYFHSIIDSPACDERDVPLDRLEPDLQRADTTPTLSYITPSLCHDGHDEPCVNGEPGGLQSADAFLAQLVPKILASPAFKLDGALVVTFDEAELAGAQADATACCGEVPGPNSENPGLAGPGGGRVGAVVVSPLVKPGTRSDVPYNHYSLLCTMEKLFDLDLLGMAAQPGLTCFGDDVFDNRPKT